MWYEVHLDRRVIVNATHRSQSMLYRAHGVRVPYRGNGRVPVGALLGWPDMGSAKALILAALADGPITKLSSLRHACASIADRYGVDIPHKRGSWYTLVSKMRGAGHIQSSHHHDRHQTYSITPNMLAARGGVIPIIAVRGSDLDSDRFKDFAVNDDTGKPMQRRAVA
jgi:hypothetical protein